MGGFDILFHRTLFHLPRSGSTVIPSLEMTCPGKLTSSSQNLLDDGLGSRRGGWINPFLFLYFFKQNYFVGAKAPQTNSTQWPSIENIRYALSNGIWMIRKPTVYSIHNQSFKSTNSRFITPINLFAKFIIICEVVNFTNTWSAQHPKFNFVANCSGKTKI